MKNKPPAKAKFFTIPDAPNYEINGYFKVRNKCTGKFIKTVQRVGKNFRYVYLKGKNSKRIGSTVNTFYRKAVAAVFDSKDFWSPISFTGNRYEMHPEGKVRNAKTKKELTPVKRRGDFYYFLKYKGQVHLLPLRGLFNICFGTSFSRRRGCVNVILSKDGFHYCFKTIKAAADFLSKKVFYCSKALERLMNKREPEIYGYSAQYIQNKKFKRE